MQVMNRLPRQSVFDQAVELVLIALCFTASVYGLVLLNANPVLS